MVAEQQTRVRVRAVSVCTVQSWLRPIGCPLRLRHRGRHHFDVRAFSPTDDARRHCTAPSLARGSAALSVHGRAPFRGLRHHTTAATLAAPRPPQASRCSGTPWCGRTSDAFAAQSSNVLAVLTRPRPGLPRSRGLHSPVSVQYAVAWYDRQNVLRTARLGTSTKTWPGVCCARR